MTNFNEILGSDIIRHLTLLKSKGYDFMTMHPPEKDQATEDSATMDAFGLFAGAESTATEDGVRTVSTNISESEYNLITHFFKTFYGLSDKWVHHKFLAYHLMKHPEARALSKEVNMLKSGFADFFANHLGPEPRYALLAARNARYAEKTIELLSDEDKISAYNYAHKVRGCSQKVLFDVVSLWNLYHNDMFGEAFAKAISLDNMNRNKAANMEELALPRRIVQSDHSDNIIKDLVHRVSADGIDVLENDVVQAALYSRIEGFVPHIKKYDMQTGKVKDIVSQVSELENQIKKEAVLFYLALTRDLLDNTINTTGIKGMQSEMEEIAEKTEKAKELLKYFTSETPSAEDLSIASLAMRKIGIRDKLNLGLVLGNKFKNMENFEDVAGYTVGPLADYDKDPKSLLTCGVPDLERLAKANRSLIVSFKGNESAEYFSP